MFTSALYPEIKLNPNTSPNKFYAVPLIGILVKVIMLIPVWFVVVFFALWMWILLMINSVMVLVTGKYWATCYNFSVGFLRYFAKVGAFLYGITDKYPGFTFDSNGDVDLNISMPQSPSRLLAIPLLGFLIRGVFLTPFYIFMQVVYYGAAIAIMYVSWFFVLFKGRYPETSYEIGFDTMRMSSSAGAYLMGLSDKYPSFDFNWNHKNLKIILLILGALLMVINWFNSSTRSDYNSTVQRQNQTAPGYNPPY